MKNTFLRKKSMFVAAALMLFTTQSAHCWSLPIKNSTKFKATVTVDYSTYLCSSDTIVIEPGKKGTIDAKNCDVDKISGFVDTPREGRKNIRSVKLGFLDKTANFSLEIVAETTLLQEINSVNKTLTTKKASRPAKEFIFKFS